MIFLYQAAKLGGQLSIHIYKNYKFIANFTVCASWTFTLFVLAPIQFQSHEVMLIVVGVDCLVLDHPVFALILQFLTYPFHLALFFSDNMQYCLQVWEPGIITERWDTNWRVHT